MDIYTYDPITSELISVGSADPDPLVEDGWLIPAYATAIEPPAPKAGFARIFADGKWSEIEDHRGNAWETETGNSVVITSLGPLDASLTDQEPGQYEEWNGSTWVYNIQLEIAAVLPAVIADINSACKAAIEGGFISNALGQDYTYDSEEEDQLNIMANVITAAKSASVMHKRKDAQGVGEYVSHTQVEMDQVGDDMYAHKMAQLVKAAALKDAANTAAAADDLAALQAITWS